jgi:uncharacterized protein YecE (DUF72 family)
MSSVAGMLRKVDQGFTFFVKGHRISRTREIKPRRRCHAFKRCSSRTASKLAGVLLQFPPGFRATQTSRDHLQWLADHLKGTRTVVEFRHAEWITPKTMNLLRELKLGYCIVDMPQVRNLPPGRVEATADVAYVRFHGKSGEWEGAATRNERYDYEYREKELQEWASKITALAGM